MIEMASVSKQVAQFKVDEVQALQELINKHKIICMAKMNKLGAAQLQSIRKKLLGKIIIRMTKNRFMKIAAAQSQRSNLADFMKEVQGSTTYIFTDMNPFKLKLFLDANKVAAPARAGDIAIKDIIVAEGNTGFPPGPVMSELKQIGLETMVKGGTIHIKKELTVVKQGQVITRQVAMALARLNLNPMEIGLHLYAAYDDGSVLTEPDLRIDIADTVTQIQTAIANAMKLSLQIAYPTNENIRFLIQKAILNAKSLILSAGIITKDTIPETLGKAYANALAVATRILKVDPNALPQDLKEQVEKKPQPSEVKATKEEKQEEKKEEEKKDLGLGSLFG